MNFSNNNRSSSNSLLQWNVGIYISFTYISVVHVCDILYVVSTNTCCLDNYFHCNKDKI